MNIYHFFSFWVAPYAGAWIEMFRMREKVSTSFDTSLPTRERGLKCRIKKWPISSFSVAPYAGAWIEMMKANDDVIGVESLPTRERGLKCTKELDGSLRPLSRSLRGSVD